MYVFISLIQLNIHKRTLTGQIYFEGNVRKGYTFDVIELQPSGVVKVGTWNELSNYTSQRLKPTSAIFENFDNTLVNRTFIILLSVPVKNCFVKINFIILPIIKRHPVPYSL